MCGQTEEHNRVDDRKTGDSKHLVVVHKFPGHAFFSKSWDFTLVGDGQEPEHEEVADEVKEFGTLGGYQKNNSVQQVRENAEGKIL